jgi:hypothetical protein
MDGTLDIQRISNLASTVERYQVRYEDLIGQTFVGAADKGELHDLLYRKLALDVSDEDLDRSLDLLIQNGRVTFPEIELRPDELAGAGLTFLPVEG